MTQKEILNKAADLMEQHGVIAGDRGAPSRGFCVLGALDWVINGGRNLADTEEICQIICKTLDLPVQRDSYNFGNWESHEARVAAWSNNLADADRDEEIIAGLRRVAASL